ncbi:4027_t:CDS:2 [Entrophospora sp. SA101]|nr:4027_t:CDS:2 [Entrophospora sp. SA101]
MEYLQELNPQQKKAVLEEHRLICVIAGPGCGKTKTLITRIIHLLTAKKVEPRQILVLTFAKKAIKEIKKRIYPYVDPTQKSELNIYNFHSFCYALLSRHAALLGFPENKFPVYDLDPLSLTEADRPKYKIYQEYQKHLQENQALDFNDLLIYTIKLFHLHPEIKKECQKQFLHILVDEFQDVNDIHLGLNPDEIYNMYQTIPSIEEKDVFVVELTKSILDPQFRVNNELPTLEKLEKEIKELEKEIEKNPNKEQKDELEKKRKNKEKVLLRHEHNIKLFLHNLIGYYVIMEGIFFYAGFAMMLALKRVNKMVAVELEKKYALDACPEGIAGINSEQFTTDLNKEKNFFETRPTEYQTGSSLKWDEEEEKNSQGKN